MPVRKGTLDKNLGRKVLDGAINIVKRFPGVDFMVYLEDIRKGRKEFSPKEFFGHLGYNIIAGGAIGLYVLFGSTDGTWTPKQRKEFRLEKEKQTQYRKSVDSSYNKLFENATKLWRLSKDLPRK